VFGLKDLFMTTMDKISSSPKAPQNLFADSELFNQALSLVAEKDDPKGKVRKSKHFHSTVPSMPSSSQKQVSKNYERALLEYMSKVLSATIVLGNNQCKLTQNQTDVGGLLLNLAEVCQKALAEKIKELENPPWWAKLLKVFSIVVSAVLVVAGIASGNFALAALSGVMFTMSASGGFEKLNEAVDKLNLPIGVKILVEAGVAAGCTIAVAGIASAMSRALSTGATLASGMSKAVALASVASVGMADHLFSDLAGLSGAEGGLKKFFELSLGVGIMFASIGMALRSNPMLVVQVFPRLQGIATGASVVLNLANAAASIGQGASMLDQAEMQKSLAKLRAKMGVNLFLLDQHDGMVKTNQEAEGATFRTYSRMNENWEAYVEPLRVGVEAMA
jgi:hypothetical protein